MEDFSDCEIDNIIVTSSFVATLAVQVLYNHIQKKKKQRRWWMRPWLRRRDSPGQRTLLHLYQELLDDGDLSVFHSTLRMSPDIYQQLLGILRPSITRMNTNYRQAITPEVRLAVTMRYLTLGESFRTLSQTFRVGLSTARAIVTTTCEAIINTMMDEYIKTPSSEQEWQQIARDFESRWDFPNVLGAADGKHIRIVAPVNSGSLYYNYKEFFSIVLLAVVDSNYNFIFVDCGSEGKASDAGIWRQCAFQQNLENLTNPLHIPQPRHIPGINGSIPYFLVGDEAFRLCHTMMKPYPTKGTMKERIFNYRLSRCRRMVENVFGILANRFRLLHRAIEVKPQTAEKVVMAMCILHNYLRRHANTSYMTPCDLDHEREDGEMIEGTWREDDPLVALQRMNQRIASQYSKQIRRKLTDYFVSKEGSVDWQYRMIH